MAPKRQAALAAKANMAAVAAKETEIDNDTPYKATKVSKGSKNVKSSDVKSNAKGLATKSTFKSTVKSTAKKSSSTKSSGVSPVPLLCCVCPNQPSFSDVSHLLTHLSSKGHLHTLSMTRVRSTADLAASEVMTTYNKWYDDNNLDRMLAERLLAKDKIANSRSKRTGQALSQPLKKKKAAAVLVKHEPNNDLLCPRTLERQQPITFYGDPGESPVMTPTDNCTDWVEEESEAVRLKGIIWPGMSIFDAATPEQKKKRNQRKDASVLQQMEVDSQAITTIELVANLDLEIERTRTVYDAPSVEGTPVAKKPKRRQQRSRIFENDDDESSEIIIKVEHHEDSLKRPSQSGRARAGGTIQMQEQVPGASASPEAESESTTEKLDVASDLENRGDADIDIDAELDDSQLGEGGSLSHFTSHQLFTLPDEHDVFHDSASNAAHPRFSDELLHEARFDIRNRIPLQPMNPNSNSSLASPTPAAKHLPHRMFKGKENNRGLQDQGLSGNYLHGSLNPRLTQARMPNVNTANPFNGLYQPQNMLYTTNFQAHWLPPVSSAPTNGFNPINGNANQHFFFPGQIMSMGANAFATNDDDQGHGMGIFGDGN